MIAMGSKKNRSKKQNSRSDRAGAVNNARLAKRRSILKITGTVLIWALVLVVFFGLALYIPDTYYNVATWKYDFLVKTGKYTAIVMGAFLVIFICLKGFSVEDILDMKPVRWIDISAFMFIFICGLSYLFSKYQFTQSKLVYKYPDGAFHGSAGWHIGLLFYGIVFMFFFLTAHFLRYTRWIMLPVILSGMLVMGWGVLGRLRISLFGWDGQSNTWLFLTSIGNIDWVCGYISVLLPVAVGFYWSIDKWWRIVILPPVFTGYLLTLLTTADSGLLALAVTFLFLAAISFKEQGRLMRFGELLTAFGLSQLFVQRVQKKLIMIGTVEKMLIKTPVILVMLILGIGFFLYGLLAGKGILKYPAFLTKYMCGIIACISGFSAVTIVALIVINTKTGGALPVIGDNSLFVFDDDWGSTRGFIWRMGLHEFKSLSFGHKLIGVGPDSFYHATKDFPGLFSMIREVYSNARLTNCHNAFLTLLINVGIVGTLAFGALLFTTMKACLSRIEEHPELIIAPLSIVMYLANNVLGFQTICNVPFLIMIMAISAAALIRFERQAKA